MKRSVVIVGVTVALALAGATAAYAAGPGTAATGRGNGMMSAGAGFGREMMGGGMMGGRMMNGAPCANLDPAALSSNLQAMSESRQAYIDSLEEQLAKATDATVKAQLTYRIEMAKLMKGSMDARLAAAKSLPPDQLDAQIALVQADLDYWSGATSADSSLAQVIASHKTAAQARLSALQAEQADQAKQ